MENKGNTSTNGAMEAIAGSFDPLVYANEHSDPATGEVKLELPVNIRVGWFRYKFPNGKMPVTVSVSEGYCVAKAKVYRSYHDADENYISEASAIREYSAGGLKLATKEAQKDAVDMALRLAGFDLMPKANPSEKPKGKPKKAPTHAETEVQSVGAQTEPAEAEAPEDPLAKARDILCPIAQYAGMTLGEVEVADPNALMWLLKKKKASQEVLDAVKLICENAVAATT